MDQLSLLGYTLTPFEKATPPEPPIAPNPNRNAIAYHQSKADYALRMMGVFLSGRKCSQVVRSHEIRRLHLIRNEALATIKQLGG